MSIIKTISTLPDTKQTLNDSVDYAYIDGYFITKKKILFSDNADIIDWFFWQDLMESGDITPLHKIIKLEYANEGAQYNESLQDFTYLSRLGKRREKAYFIWTIDKYNSVNEISGTDLYIIKYDRNNNVYLIEDESGGYRGAKTSMLALEEMMEATNSSPAYSPLSIELEESFTNVINAGFLLSEIDRQFMSIVIEYIDSNTLNFTATYNGTALNDGDIEQSDITITDLSNGDLDAGLYSYSNGVFQLKNFTPLLTNGIMTIISTLYMGCIAYRVRVVVTPIITNFDFEDAVNFDFEDGTNFDFET